jgi:hypothetical protein
VPLAALGLLLLGLGLVLRWPSMVPWAIVFGGSAYAAARAGGDIVDGWAAVVGVLLLIAAELAFWSVEHDARIRTERSLALRRVATLAGLVVCALVVDFLLLGTAAVSASSGVLLAAVGVAAAVAAIAVVVRLLRT